MMKKEMVFQFLRKNIINKKLQKNKKKKQQEQPLVEEESAIKDKVVDENTLLKAMQNYAASVKHEDPKYICHPTTWLNQGRWEDEIIVPKEKTNKNFLAG